MTEQARDWFHAPAARQAHVITRHQRLRYHRHNLATVQALAWHLRGEGFQSLDIDPGDPSAADLLVPRDATKGQTFNPTPLREQARTRPATASPRDERAKGAYLASANAGTR